MARKVPLDRLADSIVEILEEYGDEVGKDVDMAVRKVSQAGARAIRSEASTKFNGEKYAKGWTAKIEEKRLGTVGTIYNASQPGLAHLLEKGHANRGGGRTYPPVSGRVHIKPIEDKITKQFEDAVRVKI